jgi:hypothetical protein
MTPTEFWHIFNAKQPVKTYGKNKMTETEADNLLALLDEAEEKWLQP